MSEARDATGNAPPAPAPGETPPTGEVAPPEVAEHAPGSGAEPASSALGPARPKGRDASLALLDEHLRALSPSSQYAFVRVVSCFLDWLAARGLELPQVTAPLAEEYLGGLDLASTSRTYYRGILRRFFEALRAREAIASNPMIPFRHGGRRAWGGVKAASGPEALEEQFAAFTTVERQATVDAAAVALALHDIHAFTGGRGGHPADVGRCERAIALGEKKYGITPLGWLGPEHD